MLPLHSAKAPPRCFPKKPTKLNSRRVCGRRVSPLNKNQSTERFLRQSWTRPAQVPDSPHEFHSNSKPAPVNEESHPNLKSGLSSPLKSDSSFHLPTPTPELLFRLRQGVDLQTKTRATSGASGYLTGHRPTAHNQKKQGVKNE